MNEMIRRMEAGINIYKKLIKLLSFSTDPMRFIRYNNSKKVNSVMGDDTKLGIIIGCSVASVFIVTFIVIFIWKNPFR